MRQLEKHPGTVQTFIQLKQICMKQVFFSEHFLKSFWLISAYLMLHINPNARQIKDLACSRVLHFLGGITSLQNIKTEQNVFFSVRLYYSAVRILDVKVELFVHKTTEAHISCVADVMWYRVSESDFLYESTLKNSFK